jgi:uncharacterized membrane protein YphA (DoxX/SURF4 family)
VCLATIQQVALQPLVYSAPLGMLTVAILNANNARDVKEDAKSGVKTVAMMLGKSGALHYQQLLMGGAYLIIILLMLLFSSSTRQLYVLLCVPWALYTIRRFEMNSFAELPQSVAQHNLLFATMLTAALSEPMFVARVLLACLYYLGGVNNILCWQYNIKLSAMKLRNIIPGLSDTLCTVCFASAVAGQLVTSLLFMLGFHQVAMARLLLAFVIPVTFMVHDMWTIEDERATNAVTTASGLEHHGAEKKVVIADRMIPNFPSEFDNEFVHFFKNVGMIGGLVMFLEMQSPSV